MLCGEFFTNNKYEIFVPNRVAHSGPGLTMEGFSESHIYPRRTTNYLAVPIERRAAIRNLARKILNKLSMLNLRSKNAVRKLNSISLQTAFLNDGIQLY